MYVMKSIGERQVGLFNGQIVIPVKGEKSEMLLPEYARNHPEITRAENKGEIEVKPLNGDDNGDEQKETKTTSKEETAEEKKEEEKEEDHAEPESEDNENPSLETNTAGEEVAGDAADEEWVDPDEFADLSRDEMADTLKEYGIEEDADLRSKDKMTEYYEDVFE